MILLSSMFRPETHSPIVFRLNVQVCHERQPGGQMERHR